MRSILRPLVAGLWLTGDTAFADVPWPDRIVHCSETRDVTTQDIASFIAGAFPAAEPVSVVAGQDAAPDFVGYTIYSYVTDSGFTDEMAACVDRFPNEDEGIRSAIETVRSELMSKPDWFDHIPSGDELGPIQDTRSHLPGQDWTLTIGASVFSGYGLRRRHLLGLFQLDDDFCNTRECRIDRRPPE